MFLAISSGKDSMVLSRLLLESGLKHTLLHCNFKLRGKESDEDQRFLEEYAEANSLELKVKTFNTEKISGKLGLSIQETARKLRYEWFFSCINESQGSFLLTAHHLDDSIETFFINVLRGTGVKGLTGIPKINDRIVRPLSDFTVEEIYSCIDDLTITYRKDSSNLQNKYLRNKVRNSLLPQFMELDPALKSKMAALFLELEDVNSWIDETALNLKDELLKWNGDHFVFPVSLLTDYPPFLIQRILVDYGIHRKNADSLIGLARALSGSKFEMAGYTFLKDRDEIIITPSSGHDEVINTRITELPVFIQLAGETRLEIKTTLFTKINKSPIVQQIDKAKIKFPLTIRNWQEGDRIKPLGMKGSKLISDILIDAKVDPLRKRSKVIIEDATGNVVVLIGHIINDDFKIEEQTKEVISFETTL